MAIISGGILYPCTPAQLLVGGEVGVGVGSAARRIRGSCLWNKMPDCMALPWSDPGSS